MTAKPEILSIAAMVSGDITIGTAVLEGEPFVWVSGIRKLEVVCLDSHGCSYAEARVSESDKPPEETKRLLFNQNNTVGEFKVRVYRREITTLLAQEDFARQVEPARYQGQN